MNSDSTTGANSAKRSSSDSRLSMQEQAAADDMAEKIDQNAMDRKPSARDIASEIDRVFKHEDLKSERLPSSLHCFIHHF